MLHVKDLEVRYGPIQAVKKVDLHVGKGEIVAVIGANGAGKTSLIKAIAGLLPRSGEVIFDGEALPQRMAERTVSRGLALVPEGRGILGRMTVEENLMMGAYSRSDRSGLRHEIDAVMDRFPVLRDRRDSLAGLLSGGEQQMLAIGRALLARPRLLMLDEPSLGLAPLIIEQVFSIIEELRKSGITILLVEQKARQTLTVADRAYVLELGKVIAEGPASDLANDNVVADAFLGGGDSSLRRTGT